MGIWEKYIKCVFFSFWGGIWDKFNLVEQIMFANVICIKQMFCMAFALRIYKSGWFKSEQIIQLKSFTTKMDIAIIIFQ